MDNFVKTGLLGALERVERNFKDPGTMKSKNIIETREMFSGWWRSLGEKVQEKVREMIEKNTETPLWIKNWGKEDRVDFASRCVRMFCPEY